MLANRRGLWYYGVAHSDRLSYKSKTQKGMGVPNMNDTISAMHEIDVALFVFLERYAPSLIKWNILTYFGAHPNHTVTALELSQQLNKNYQVVRRNVGDLALLGVLEMDATLPQPIYRLTTANPSIRATVERIATDPSYSPFHRQ